MTSIRQHIPSFVQGQTDQPDELKRPGQVREMTNVFPDVTLQCIKRPGLEYLGTLSGATSNGKWFNIFAENVIGIEEQYICNIRTDGQIFIWAAIDIYSGPSLIHGAGEPIDITFNETPDEARSYPQPDLPRITAAPMATPPGEIASYLSHFKNDDLQVLTVNNYTFITNRQKFPTMAGNTASSRPYEAYVSLKQISYNRQYSLNIASPDAQASTDTTATSVSLYTSPDDYDAIADCAGTFDEEVTFNRNDNKTDLRVRLINTCQAVPEQEPDSGDDYDSRYTHDIDLLFGGNGWVTGDTVYKNYTYKPGKVIKWTVQVSSHSTFTAYNDIGSIRPTPTPSSGDTVLTGSSILGDVANEINAIAGFTATIIGNGIYILGDQPFQITTTESDLWNILSTTSDSDGRYSTINNVANLPSECKHGYIVKVANSSAVEDDYYLEFFGNNDVDGVGVWEETVKPGVRTNFNFAVMPHQLVRGWNGDNTKVVFELSPIYWNPRTAGDDITNPIPSFVKYDDNAGGPINKMLLYRNRLVMLSGENVVLSQSGDLFNFFSDTALTITASDPIDITAAVDSSSVLYDGLVVNNGMLLFSKFNQFLFTTDSDILNPSTAKSTLIAAYDFNQMSNPFVLNSNVGFYSNAGNDSVFWEMKDIYREGPPIVEERSKAVTRTLPAGLDIISASKEDGTVMATKKGIKDIWGYRYFYSGTTQLQDAWFKWTVPGEIIHAFNNTRGKYWVVYNDNGSTRLVRLDLKSKKRAYSLEGQPYEYYVYMDNWANIGRPVYNSTTKKSEFLVPFTPNQTLYAYSLENGNYRGRYAEVEVVGSTGFLPGNWTEADLTIGYKYEMEIKFPHLFLSKREGNFSRSDTSGSLTLHRVRINFGTVGIYTVDINRYGKDNYSLTIETTEMDGYDADRVAAYPDKIYTIPIYDRTENTLITLKSDHPTPATLNSLTFEGDYTDKYYKRV